MSRLQKKCVFAASGFHLLLFVILIVGPAFLSANDVESTQVLEFIPMMTTDKAFAGGGSPTAAPPPPAPPQVQPTPPQPQVTPPPPAPPQVTPPPVVKNDPDSLEPAKTTKPKIQVSTTVVKRRDVKKPVKTTSDATSTAEAQEAAQRAKAFKVAASQLRSGLSSSTKVEMVGPGGGGPTYARYRDLVQKMYYDAWIEPNADGGIGAATVVIAKDGTVLSSRIVQSSGNAAVDRSIQDALDRVKFIAPFPEGATEEQRTYTIRFNLEAKKSTG